MSAQRGEGALERKVADHGRLQNAEEQGIGGERIEARAVEQARRRQTRRPSRHRPGHRLADRGIDGGERRADAGEGTEQLRPQRERAREAGGGFVELALRVQHKAEIVAGLGMIGLEQQQALVHARGVAELVVMLQAGRFGEHLADRIAARTGPLAAGRRVPLGSGAALFSVHPL